MPASEAYSQASEKDPLSDLPSHSISRYDDHDSDNSDDTIDELDPLRSDHSESDDGYSNAVNGDTIPLRKQPRRGVKRRKAPSPTPKSKGEPRRARVASESAHTSESSDFNAHRRALYRPLSKLRKWLMPTRRLSVALLLLLFLVLAVLGGGSWWSSPPKIIISTSDIGETIDGLSPPWYPTPRGGIARTWEESYKKAAKLVERMTLIEKVNITTGTGWMMGMCVGNTGPAPAAGFPSLCLQDGPLGVRFADNITATPAGITVGSTWNRELMFKRGRLLGVEARMKGVNVLLGPSVGPLGKFPAGGRNWEGFGSDPYLQGIAAGETVRGIQSEHVMATIKHFVGNEQEHFRQSYEWNTPNAISSNIDDRTLHEVYAWPFGDAVKAGVASVMCSYNQVNNSYACQNSKLLNGILKDELGFQGFVQSDWLAQRSGVASALAGLDMSMPGDGRLWQDGHPYWGHELTLAALNGSLPMERLDDMVTRIVAAWYQVGQDSTKNFPEPGPNFSSWTNDRIGLLHPGSNDKTRGVVNKYVPSDGEGGFSHIALARRIAAEGTVLLKNDGNVLPLSREGWPQSMPPEERQGHTYRVAIFGEDAVLTAGGPNECEDRGCNKGTLASGWGSGSVEFPYIISPYSALQDAFHDAVEVSLAPDNDSPDGMNGTDIGIQDLCIVFVNSDGGEGYLSWEDVKGDRNRLRLQKGGEELIKRVAEKCGTTNARLNPSGGDRGLGDVVVVIHAVGPVVLEEFISLPNVRSVLWANLPGQESGNALKDIIFGDLNPSGRLPFTIGGNEEVYGPGAQIMYESGSMNPQQDFQEGLFIDYRYYEQQNYGPRYAFGFGLSYTDFVLSQQSLRVGFPNNDNIRPSMFPLPRPPNAAEPPEYNSTVPDPSEALFPPRFKKLNRYIYPYIDSTDDAIANGTYPYPESTNGTLSDAGGDEGGNPALWDILVYIDVDVLNVGPRDGQTVIQLYLKFPDNVYEEYEAGQHLLERDADPQAEVNGERQQPQDQSPHVQVDPVPQDGINNNSKSDPSAATEPQLLEVQPPDTDADTATADVPHDNADQPTVDESINPPDGKQNSSKADDPAESAGEDKKPPTDQEKVDDPPPPPPPPPKPSPIPRPTFSGPTERTRINFPVKVLRGFDKVYVPRQQAVPAESKFHGPDNDDTVIVGGVEKARFHLTRRDLSYWSTRYQNWVLPHDCGPYELQIGFNVLDIQVRHPLWIEIDPDSGNPRR